MSGYLVILVDASEAPDWPAAARLTAEVLAALPEDSVLGVHLLGSNRRWDADLWQPDLALPPDACTDLSVIAPVWSALRRRRDQAQGAIFIGASQPLDFDDWADSLTWARVGATGVGSTDRRIATFESPDEPGLTDWARAARRFSRPSRVTPTGFERGQWRLDPTAFPMVWVEPLQAFWQLWPMTKPQVERWLVQARQPGYDRAWYVEVLRKNPRLSPNARSVAATEQLFVTSLWPAEVEAAAAWCGPEFRAPSVAEWQTAFRWLAGQPVSVPPAGIGRDMALPALRLWTALFNERHPKTLLDLSLMRLGIVEWTTSPNGGWEGMGAPRTDFHPHFHDALSETWPPAAPDRRSRLFGMRLLAC